MSMSPVWLRWWRNATTAPLRFLNVSLMAGACPGNIFQIWPGTFGNRHDLSLLAERLFGRHIGDDPGLVAGVAWRDQLIKSADLDADDDRLLGLVLEEPAVHAVERCGER